MEAGEHEIGFDGEGFCFDSELALHRIRLDDYQIANRLVTNREFIEFIDDGAYADFRLWTPRRGIGSVRIRSKHRYIGTGRPASGSTIRLAD